MAGQTTTSRDSTSLLKEGMRLLESGDVNAAIANFSRVIETEPGRAAAYRLRGSPRRLHRRSIGWLKLAHTAGVPIRTRLAGTVLRNVRRPFCPPTLFRPADP
jgi:hypothetical protein